MRDLHTGELGLVAGGHGGHGNHGGHKPASHPFPPGQHPSRRNPAHSPGESYKGPADKNFGPK